MLFLSQSGYIGKVLMYFNMEGRKVWSISLPSYVKLSLSDCPKFDAKRADITKVPYCSMVGSLMYAMICTRPNIAYAMGVVNRYMSNISKKHWKIAKGIKRYLSSTCKVCIFF